MCCQPSRHMMIVPSNSYISNTSPLLNIVNFPISLHLIANFRVVSHRKPTMASWKSMKILKAKLSFAGKSSKKYGGFFSHVGGPSSWASSARAPEKSDWREASEACHGAGSVTGAQQPKRGFHPTKIAIDWDLCMVITQNGRAKNEVSGENKKHVPGMITRNTSDVTNSVATSGMILQASVNSIPVDPTVGSHRTTG